MVFVESAAAMGGVQFSTLYLVQHLNSTLWEPIVVCPEEGDLTEACRRSGIRVHIIDHPSLRSTSLSIGRNGRLPNPAAWLWDGWATFIASRKLTRFLRQTTPDLVVTKGISSHFCGGLAARWLSIPCVWHVQDLISERSFKIYKHVFCQVARHLPDQIIVDGAPIAEQLPQTVQRAVSIIHNGVDTDVFLPGLDNHSIRRELLIPSGAIVIGNVGRMTFWKGQHYLVDAFARIAFEIPKAYLLLVGGPLFDSDTYERRLRKQASELGIGNRVIFAGYRRDLPRVLAAMDVFAFPSTEKDTSPLAVLSAMASGLPIVAFDIDGMREIVTSGKQGLLVPVLQVGALAETLARVLRDDKLRHRLATEARRSAETEFGLKRYVCRVEEVFLKTVHSAPLSGMATAVEI